ncbi:hypothetical protein DQ04_00011110 [Trypanosoma grayi]|uniref:hypothetical protein n=1 Tax=Trypanosoma grayi TaxID=71804 RepID=UPI0004F40924|nr:hypothetical protein DQ04_00011110 [Trypanosoma grayi]KEG15644.1 hypothetical protein DQ04_00011110 [Trypanosoma grayi]
MRRSTRREKYPTTALQPLQRDRGAGSTMMMKSALDAHHQQQEQQQVMSYSDPAEMTVGCAMAEMAYGRLHNSHPTQDAQVYLQRRVAEIVSQIKSASSAHHFDRHVVEIDELLRCDAPMGFTPSMVLAGIPDILYMLSEAVRHGYLLRPTEKSMPSVQALTPVRKGPHAAMSTKRITSALEVTAGRDEKKISRSFMNHGNAVKTSGKGRGESSVGAAAGDSGGDVLSTDILPFLPPLVRRPATPPHATNEAAVPQMQSFRTRASARQQSHDTSSLSATTTKICLSETMPPLRKRKGPITFPPTADGASLASIPQVVVVSTADRKQQQPTPTPSDRVDADSPVHVAVLRDIPSALQALLYHCALPLVCLTAEDHRQRIAAVRILASAMAKMLRVTLESAHVKLCFPQKDNDEDHNNKISTSSSSSEKDGDKDDALISNSQDVTFRIRHAAIMSLHALMTFIEAENSTSVNQHFASRDRQHYEKFGAAKTSGVSLITRKEENDGGSDQWQAVSGAIGNEPTPVAAVLLAEGGVSPNRLFRLTDPCLKTPEKSPRMRHISRTAPLSMYNNAVALDVVDPLIERWMAILQKHASYNALLDSTRQLFRCPAAMQATDANANDESKRDAMVIMTVGGSKRDSLQPMEALGGTAVFASGTRMDEGDAEEIYLVLRVCLHLSTYKHHVQYLIGCDTTYASLPVLVCLTMARCTDGDRCLPLCVECLWNLLEAAPEETVRMILLHTVQKEKVSEPSMPAETDGEKCQAERSLASLSASESLLHTFVQTLLSGHRLLQRELRNDMVILVLMILNIHTTLLRRQEEALLQSADAEQIAPLPSSTIDAINAIAIAVFDMVCGPELRMVGSTANITQRPVEMFVRYNTVLSPTARTENMQFKLLGWRMLESFCAWQSARLAVWRDCRNASQSTTDAGAPEDVDDGDAASVVYDGFIFDVCQQGFIDVLLLYVDTTCGDDVVVAWTREELLTLQEEAWRVLVALMESAVSSPLRWRSVAGASVSVGAKAVLFNKSNKKNSCDDTAAVVSLPLVRADDLFVAAGGIACAARYIQETTAADAQVMVRLAVRALSVLSRRPDHRSALLAATEVTLRLPAPVNGSVPLLVALALQVIQDNIKKTLVSSAEMAANLKSATRAITCKGTNGSVAMLPQRPLQKAAKTTKNHTSSNHRQEGKERADRRQNEMQQESREEGGAVVVIATGNEDEVALEAIDNTHVYFTAQARDVVIYCLSLLYNLTGGNSDNVAMTQEAFMSLGGVSLLLQLVRFSLSSPLGVGEENSELLRAVLDCVRAFVLGNDVIQEQFVQEDGVHILLSIVEVFAGQCIGSPAAETSECGAADQSPLTPTLTILADLLHKCAEAREAFLQWCSYATEEPRDMEDDGCINATQLLLRLWIEGPATNNEPLAHTIQEPRPQQQQQQEACVVNVEENAENRNNGSEVLTAVSQQCSAGGSFRQTDKTVDLPVLRADCWGLQILGLHSREIVTAELRNRYRELECCDAGVTSEKEENDSATQQARERLAASLCHVLGLRVKIYACLAAVGFDRLVDVKSSALERVKLLHVAALPSVCRDEIWSAIAECVDLRGRACIVPLEKNKDNNNSAGDAADVTQQPAVVPIVPDADQLLKVLLDVDAHTTELRSLAQACIDMHTAHEEEATRRFFLSRLRQGSDDAGVITLVQQARSRNTGDRTPAALPTRANRAVSVVENVMGRVRLEDERTDVSPNAESTSAGMSGWMYTASRMTMLQKKRKRDAMIKGSLRQH